MTLEKRPEDLIAIVGDQKIYLADFDSELKRRGGRQLDKLDKNKLLDEMILRSSMIDQAIKAGIDKQPDFIRTYQNLLVGQYKKRFLKPLIDGVDLSADEIQRHYTENIQKYTQPAKARLAMIYMKTHPKMSDAKKSQIMERMKEAQSKAKQPVKGRGFGRISVQYSEDQVSRYKGGDIGWIYENRSYRWDDKVLKAGFALEELNDISDIITTDKGLYIVKLLDRRPAKVTPFKQVKARIRHKQLLERRKNTEQSFEKDVRQKTPVEIYSDTFDKVSIPKAPNKNQLPVPSP
ncbi:peptidyl-prolyl cis-trans isomerase [Candidatus Magnetomorum sp. HK-1]|nr:peptidyl-prolyl cis-trans isomerase [Candidatus Magnetomorum sp. HK-1]